jgi:hypothetical protein
MPGTVMTTASPRGPPSPHSSTLTPPSLPGTGYSINNMDNIWTNWDCQLIFAE